MNELPEIRGRSEILPALALIGETEVRLESIQFEGRRYLVLHWVVPEHEEWMQPRRLVLIDGLDYEIETSPEALVIVRTPIPADAKPENEPHETAEITFVLDYPQTLFEAHRRQ